MKGLLRFFLLFCSLGVLQAQTTQKLIPFLKGELYGYTTIDKNKVIDFQFTKAYPFGYEYKGLYYPDLAMVEIKYAPYLLNRKGELISYQDFLKKEFKKYSFIIRGKQKINTQYVTFIDGNKQGVKDIGGNVVVPAIYDDIMMFSFEKEYWNDDSNSFCFPTYVAGEKQGEYTLLRVDKPEEYTQTEYNSFSSNHLLVSKKIAENTYQYGVLGVDGLHPIDSKYINVYKFYETDQIIHVGLVVNKEIVSMYIGIDGTEYYEE
ncbi:MAG: hypothetical protein LBE34_15595 [Flavobacteriaceae bacterium]|jgi:hypothetical protein|nr:hypothetical protein [Flavobacteriaceae bacterium]